MLTINPIALITQRLLLLLMLAVLSACSVKTLYNNMDSLIVEYVDGMVELDDPLEFELRDQANALVAWHREDQLDDYASLLRTMQQDFGPELSVQTIELRADTLRSFWYALKSRLDEDMVVFLPRLDAEQREELFVSLQDRNSEYREDYVDIDADERLENYLDNTRDSYENWLGDLNKPQLRLIESAAAEFKSSAEGRLQVRKYWQQNVRSILESDTDTADKQAELRRFFAGFDSNEAAGVKGVAEHNSLLIARLTRDIVKLADADQREHFIDKTDEYIEVIEELRRVPAD